MGDLLLFSGPSWPEVGHPCAGRCECGGALVWTFVPERDAEPRGPGVATCRRCEKIAELAPFPDRYDAPAEVEPVSVDEELDDEDDLDEFPRARVARWLRGHGLPVTPAQRSATIDAWLASDEAAALEAQGHRGGALLGCLTRMFPMLEVSHG